jgi:two-component system phosphate regulon sensor histidine kinase PhoR
MALLLALADARERQRLADKVLEPAGYRVLTAGTCTETRQLMHDEDPPLLLLGDSFEDGEPLEMAEELRATHPNLPIVVLAGANDLDSVLRCMRLGAVDYLIAPYKKPDLLEAVGRALQHRRNWEQWVKKETGRLTGTLNKRLSELEAILKQVDNGVLVLDSTKRVMLVNPALRQAFGLGKGAVLGSTLEELFGGKEMLEAVVRRDEADEHVEVEGKDGRIYSLHTSRVPGVGIVVTLHDISYLKELDRLKGDFVNTVSHDLRSPLTAILGYVELIERAGEVNEQQAEFIKRVKTSVHSTTDLIGDLLNLGRMEVGLVEDVEQLHMDELVKTSIETMSSRAKAKKQNLRLSKPDKLSEVLGSRIQLRQVADNLIGNALKYTQEGGEIRVMLREEEGQVILHVADNGPGIPAGEQGKIFEKFYRASNVGDDVQGTGLGLAIVQTVVDNHRGRIWVDSKPGQGSVFTVVLPIAPVE